MKVQVTPNCALSVFCESHFMAVQTTHQRSQLTPSVLLPQGAESFPHCAFSRDQQSKYDTHNAIHRTLRQQPELLIHRARCSCIS